MKHPLDYLGSDGGGGVGAGPGISVGAALALQGIRPACRSRSCGDGDFMMGVDRAVDRGRITASRCWIVVANNRSFYNDELHQERMARSAAGRSRTIGSASR